jgi:hypothetical protein
LAQADAQKAEAAVARAADAILAGEAQDLVAEIETHYAVLLRLGERLRGYLPSGAVPIGYAAPPSITKALSLVPLRDQIYEPVNQLGPRADFVAYDRRRAALIAGDDDAVAA